MKTLQDYLDLARRNQKIASNNKLAAALGLKGPTVVYLQAGKTIPTDETMIKLAELAGISEEEALLDVSLWRAAKSSPRAKAAWERLAHTLASVALTLTFCLLPLSAKASAVLEAEGTQSLCCTMYIMLK